MIPSPEAPMTDARRKFTEARQRADAAIEMLARPPVKERRGVKPGGPLSSVTTPT